MVRLAVCFLTVCVQQVHNTYSLLQLCSLTQRLLEWFDKRYTDHLTYIKNNRNVVNIQWTKIGWSTVWKSNCCSGIVLILNIWFWSFQGLFLRIHWILSEIIDTFLHLLHLHPRQIPSPTNHKQNWRIILKEGHQLRSYNCITLPHGHAEMNAEIPRESQSVTSLTCFQSDGPALWSWPQTRLVRQDGHC